MEAKPHRPRTSATTGNEAPAIALSSRARIGHVVKLKSGGPKPILAAPRCSAPTPEQAPWRSAAASDPSPLPRTAPVRLSGAACASHRMMPP